MENDWVVFIIDFRSKPNNVQEEQSQKMRLLVDFVKPTIDLMQSRGLLRTFHFFFEPDGFHLRVRAMNQNQIVDIERIITDNLQKFPKLTSTQSSYTGEENDYGTEGWLYVQKFFEYCCRISLLKKETMKKLKEAPTLEIEILKTCKVPTQTHPHGLFFNAKLIHCFSNQSTLNILQETEYYFFDLFMERIETMRIHLPETLKKTKLHWVNILEEARTEISNIS